MNIILNNKYCQIVDDVDNVKRILYDNLFYYYPNYERTKAYQNGWDGRVFLIKKDRFKIGLLPIVLDMLKGYDVKLVDNRQKKVTFFSQKKVELRDYQQNCVSILKSNRLNGLIFPIGIINGATNAGKSYIILDLLLSGNFSHGLILLHNADIVSQLEKFISEYAKINNWSNEISLSRINISTYRKLKNRITKSVKNRLLLKEIDVLICDEVHRAGSKDYQFLLENIEPYVSLGFSGTALSRGNRSSNLHIMEHFGKVLYKISNKELIEKGVSEKPTVILKKIKSGFIGAYKIEYPYNIERNKERNNFIAEYCKKNRQILITVKTLAHGTILENKIKGSYFLSGDDESREQVIQAFKERKIKVLITTVLQEGVNIPCIDTLIYARGGQSKISVLQYVGRVLRKGGKKKVHIIDFIDYGNLKRHSDARLRIYEDEGFKIKFK